VFRVPERPEDKLRLLHAFECITKVLRDPGVDALVPAPKIFEELAKPPFGIRDGLLPFILAIYLATQHQRVALYEDGTYLHTLQGDVLMRLMKEPQAFRVQYCALEGPRMNLFKTLMRQLKIESPDSARQDILDIVRPLVIFATQKIPEYSRRTATVSAMAIEVRQALLTAKEPNRLVFELLPAACGIPKTLDPSKHAEQYASQLSVAIHELQAAYGALIDRLWSAIQAAFDGTADIAGDRQAICDRARQLATFVSQPHLRAFALRLADKSLTDRAWIESVANLLAKKSAERWIDSDETEFYHQLEIAAGHFRRLEFALLDGARIKLNGHACRVALTKTDGTERTNLIRWEDMDDDRLKPIEKEIRDVIARHGRRGLAATMKVLWKELETDGE
jgi:hypothetical protein